MLRGKDSGEVEGGRRGERVGGEPVWKQGWRGKAGGEVLRRRDSGKVEEGRMWERVEGEACVEARVERGVRWGGGGLGREEGKGDMEGGCE